MTKVELVKAMQAAVIKIAQLKKGVDANAARPSYNVECNLEAAEKCIRRAARGTAEYQSKMDLEIILEVVTGYAVYLMELNHCEALVMNAEYDAQLAEIQRIEFHSVIDADLVKVCSMRMFLFQRCQRQHVYTMISFDKYINPLFDLLDKIATDLAGRVVYASEHNWIVEEAAHDENFDREFNSIAKEEIEEAKQEAEVNPYEILFNIMGEDAFCKAILKPEAYAAYQAAKENAPVSEEEQEAILLEMNEHNHGYRYSEAELVGETFDDLHPPRPTGFENELRNIW